MNNEIKEVLDNLAKKSSIYKMQINRGTSFNTDEYEASLLLDYITNLQEANERLKSKLDKKPTILTYDYTSDVYEELEIYKSRIDKAISLLKEAGCYDEETKTFCDDVWDELPDLLNILQGSDKE